MVGRGLISAVLAAVCGATAACGDLQSVARRHERLCREQAGIIVHDLALWNRYREGARATYAARAREYGEGGSAPALEYVEGFAERFGPALSNMRPTISGRLERNDITILHDIIRVATAVDIIGSYPAFGHTQSFTCLSYPVGRGSPAERAGLASPCFGVLISAVVRSPPAPLPRGCRYRGRDARSAAQEARERSR